MSASPALCILGHSDQTLWGRTPAERLRRQFAQAGVTRAVTRDEALKDGGPVILVRADAVLDQPLVAILATRPGLALIGEGPDGQMPVAAFVEARDLDAAVRLLSGEGADLALDMRAPGDLDAAFWKGLRKRETPYAFAVAPGNHSAVEWRMFMGTYKGATDFVTKHVWPWPAFHATRTLAGLGVTPNWVTLVGAILTIAAFWLFLEGAYATGLAAAWGMTFLDTVDGKLARTTLTSSKWGDVFDHGIDLVHPPFWYVAWALGLSAVGQGLSDGLLWTVVLTILVGYVLQRAVEGIAIKWLGLEIHIWRPIDTWFRQITARRNPNLAILTVATLLGRPDWGLIAVAGWTALCFVLHVIQLAQAFAAKRQNGPLSSWMELAAPR
ncbi:MAG TPA: CDP-alcohol phosphatidyltransferase family protein [Aestuariivirgaceae bacterium]|nr:CDP-alcohol phosphatidyltransferase family protein [Aestuariivirgaceae bacterium]